jgi:hypothetical protein
MRATGEVGPARENDALERAFDDRGCGRCPLAAERSKRSMAPPSLVPAATYVKAELSRRRGAGWGGFVAALQ